MTNSGEKTILCICSYEKGQEFLRECKRQQWRVILLTVTALEHADWPRESIDEIFYMPDLAKIDDVIRGVSYLARTRIIDRIVALDDYDVWPAAALREHFRMPGMGDSTVRYFRDKLAMRVKAQQHDIPVPAFIQVLNHQKLHEFMTTIPAPWVMKPRAEASTIGITKMSSPEHLWERVNTLGDLQSFYVLERYIPGQVCHIDSLVYNRKVVFCEVHQYGRPPLDVFHEGGISTTRTLIRGSKQERTLKSLNRKVLTAFGMEHGAVHMEFIMGDDGNFYFLETAARVGGASIVDLIEASTGINLWREWAKIEIAVADGRPYELPQHKQNYAGVIISLARQEHPDTSAYQDAEIVWRLQKRHHVGFVVASPEHARVQTLLNDYTQRFAHDFSASLPPFEGRPPSTE